MAAMISVGHVCEFKDGGAANNHVVGAPRYLAKMLNGEGDNPFREFLSEVEPGCMIDVQVTLSVIGKKR